MSPECESRSEGPPRVRSPILTATETWQTTGVGFVFLAYGLDPQLGVFGGVELGLDYIFPSYA
jgi:hypothetical protein